MSPEKALRSLNILKKITKRAETEDGWLDITLECGHELLAMSNGTMEVGDEVPCAECLMIYLSERRKVAEKASMN